MTIPAIEELLGYVRDRQRALDGALAVLRRVGQGVFDTHPEVWMIRNVLGAGVCFFDKQDKMILPVPKSAQMLSFLVVAREFNNHITPVSIPWCANREEHL